MRALFEPIRKSLRIRRERRLWNRFCETSKASPFNVGMGAAKIQYAIDIEAAERITDPIHRHAAKMHATAIYNQYTNVVVSAEVARGMAAACSDLLWPWRRA